MSHLIILTVVFVLVAVSPLSAQSRIDALVAALRPALPFPAATADGEFPADNSTEAEWFVVWPTTPDDVRVVVKANPLHPATQKAAAVAMRRIQEAVVAAERKAQAAYDRALDELRRTGRTTDIDGISLEDEGIAGERIDADLELGIELEEVQPFSLRSGAPPTVTSGTSGAMWSVSIPGNVYRDADGREHFRPAETLLYFGPVTRPAVSRKGDGPDFAISVLPAPQGFVVALRGNEALLTKVAATVNWSLLAAR